MKTLEDLLKAKYGEKGSASRIEFEKKAQAFYMCQRIKDERKKAKLTQSELAEKISTQKQFISRIEKGQVNVQLSTFLAILDALGLHIELVPNNVQTA